MGGLFPLGRSGDKLPNIHIHRFAKTEQGVKGWCSHSPLRVTNDLPRQSGSLSNLRHGEVAFKSRFVKSLRHSGTSFPDGRSL